MTVEAINEAIAELGPQEKASLSAWLIEQDATEWSTKWKKISLQAALGWLCLKKPRLMSAPAGCSP
jgi:hypothetical protein